MVRFEFGEPGSQACTFNSRVVTWANTKGSTQERRTSPQGHGPGHRPCDEGGTCGLGGLPWEAGLGVLASSGEERGALRGLQGSLLSV